MSKLIQNSPADCQFSELVGDISQAVEKFLISKTENKACDSHLRLEHTQFRSSPTMVATDYGKLAEKLYAERRRRDQAIGLDGLLGEPVWDILLDLTIAYERQEKLTVSAVVIGSEVPATTALRYIGVLEKRGLIKRTPDTEDGRRTWVRLTEHGVTAMHKALAAIQGTAKSETNVAYFKARSA